MDHWWHCTLEPGNRYKQQIKLRLQSWLQQPARKRSNIPGLEAPALESLWNQLASVPGSPLRNRQLLQWQKSHILPANHYTREVPRAIRRHILWKGQKNKWRGIKRTECFIDWRIIEPTVSRVQRKQFKRQLGHWWLLSTSQRRKSQCKWLQLGFEPPATKGALHREHGHRIGRRWRLQQKNYYQRCIFNKNQTKTVEVH